MRKTAEWRRMDEFVNLPFQSFRKDSASRKWRTVTEKEQTFVSFAKMQENFLDKTDTGMLP